MKDQMGVYVITNTHSGCVYVGSSIRASLRMSEHRLSLVRRDHFNNRLQASWDADGPDSFTFSIIEQCSIEEMEERELAWIEHFKAKPAGVYNKFMRTKKDRGGAPRPRESYKTIQVPVCVYEALEAIGDEYCISSISGVLRHVVAKRAEELGIPANVRDGRAFRRS